MNRLGTTGATKPSTKLYSFRTPPALGSRVPLTFGVIADVGQTEDSAATYNHILADTDVVSVIHAGDMSYADCDQERWDVWGRLVEPLASKVPYMVAVGNHEIEQDHKTGDNPNNLNIPRCVYKHLVTLTALSLSCSLSFSLVR